MKYPTKYILQRFETAVRLDEMRSGDPEEVHNTHKTYLAWKRLIMKCLKKKNVKI